VRSAKTWRFSYAEFTTNERVKAPEDEIGALRKQQQVIADRNAILKKREEAPSSR
jgi:hypothetical protein